MIDLIFNILNLTVLAALIFYAFYYYLLPKLKSSFNEYKDYLKNLSNKQEELQKGQKDLEQKILDQEKLGIILKDKINKWSHTINEYANIQNKTFHNLSEELSKKIYRQAEIYNYENAKKAITSELIKTIEKDLNSYFQNPENVERYFANLFNELK